MGSNPIGSTIVIDMRHFVQYHNPDIMGPYKPSEGDYWIVTNKRGGLEKGNTVWLVTGEGKPRRYSLCEMFVVDRIESHTLGEFKYRASGSSGIAFGSRIEIGDMAWFRKLLRITRNFRYGLQPVKDPEIVEAFEFALRVLNARK